MLFRSINSNARNPANKECYDDCKHSASDNNLCWIYTVNNVSTGHLAGGQLSKVTSDGSKDLGITPYDNYGRSMGMQ